jgi:hypothetical protein
VEIGRHTVAYRAAVWCGRLAVVCTVTWFILALLDTIKLVFVLVAAACVVSWFLAYELLGWGAVDREYWVHRLRIPDPRVRRQFYRDLFWLPLR